MSENQKAHKIWSRYRFSLRAVIVDQRKREVINLKYLNQSAIHLEAFLYFPELLSPVVISSDKLDLGGRTVRGTMCFIDNLNDVEIRTTRSGTSH